jgi:hypothetical protein
VGGARTQTFQIMGVLEDVWHAQNEDLQVTDTFVVGPLKWLTVDPGRQVRLTLNSLFSLFLLPPLSSILTLLR